MDETLLLLFCRGILSHTFLAVIHHDLTLMYTYAPIYIHTVSVLLASVPSSVVCLLGLVWELCQAAICGFMLYEQWLCVWAGCLWMALLLWLFFFPSFCLYRLCVSLLLPPCTWEGMVDKGVGVLVATVAFCEGLWLWLHMSAGAGWVEELTCLFPAWRPLKEYTKFCRGSLD